MSALLEAALAYAARGWPVLPVLERAKLPLTRHGVKDASTDPALIVRWFERWPTANLAIACGTPGPQVLDVDDLDAMPPDRGRLLLDAPTVATARGRHFYGAGADRPTVAYAYGELRGRGSYVLAPPSVHPSGRVYVWLLEPTGPLPTIPELSRANGAGVGEHEAPVELVPHGQRHPYLKDFAVRMLRAGVTDAGRIEAHLRLEFELSCAPLPAPARGYFETLARWAAHHSRIASRERRRAALAERIRTHREEQRA